MSYLDGVVLISCCSFVLCYLHLLNVCIQAWMNQNLIKNSSRGFYYLVLPSDLCFLLKTIFKIYLQFDTLCVISIFSHTHPPTMN